MPNLVIVSNRLPVSVKKVDGKLEYSKPVGGLAMGMASYTADSRNKWIGWPGLPSDDLTQAERQEISDKLREQNCYPLFLTQRQLDGFYNGYSNRFLWPLFHDVAISKSAKKHETAYWKVYGEVNKLYMQKVLELSTPESNIWVHDYHLLLLPGQLRAKRPANKIGFFLHIPFPNAKDFSQLTHGKQLVRGLLGADMLGFHITSYVNNFLDVVKHYKLATVEAGKIVLPDRSIRVTDFPIGIDYKKWRHAGRKLAVRKEYARLTRKYSGKKIIIAVDRLDPTKGYLERVQAYHDLLERNAKLLGKVQLVMYAVPTRSEIEEYQKLKVAVEELVHKINTRFGTKRWQPVEYNYASLTFEPLRALYQRADVAFVTPLRDGMNLTAKEYLASKPRGRGVLVLSETAGAAQELHEAVLVNPKKPASMVAGLEMALLSTERRAVQPVVRMQDIIKKSTIQTWSGGFMRTLRRSSAVAAGSTTRLLDQPLQQQLVADYKTALKRLILLDYDGTLVPFAATPGAARPTAELRQLLARLTALPGTEVVVVSGRPKDNLDDWLGSLGLHFGAEHGAFVRSKRTKKWQAVKSRSEVGWQSAILPILELYAAKAPGAFVEQKSTALVWHYRNAKPYAAQKNLVILRRVLRPLAESMNIEVKQGNKVLEIRAADISKGAVAEQWLEVQPDFVMAIGDDYTDEDMFAALPKNAYTIKVGRGETAARFRLRNVAAVHNLLQKL